MDRTKLTLGMLGVLFGLLFSSYEARSQNEPRRLYEIIAGEYDIIGGFAPLHFILPTASQKFIALSVQTQSQTARMDILQADQQTAFLSLSNGLVSGNSAHFLIILPPKLGSLQMEETYDYTVTWNDHSVSMNGTLTKPIICCDIPYLYIHTNVMGRLLPDLTIRVSEVEICWLSRLGQTYQVEYRSTLTGGEWLPLGPPVTGNGTTNCVTDPVPAGEPRRFYHVVSP